MTEMLNQDSRPEDDQSLTREAWLHRAIEEFRPRFTEIGLPLPARLHVSVGFGYSSRAESKYILGQCWARRASADGVNHIFLGPQEGDPAAMLVSLLHELIHAADDCQSGHKGAFAEAATRLGFEGPMTRTPPGLDLTAEVITLAEALGPFPQRQARPHHGQRARTRPARRGPRPRPRRQGAQRPRQAGNPHDQADRRMLRLHRPHHPQVARRGLPALPARPAHARRVTPTRKRLNTPDPRGPPGAFKHSLGLATSASLNVQSAECVPFIRVAPRLPSERHVGSAEQRVDVARVMARQVG